MRTSSRAPHRTSGPGRSRRGRSGTRLRRGGSERRSSGHPRRVGRRSSDPGTWQGRRRARGARPNRACPGSRARRVHACPRRPPSSRRRRKSPSHHTPQTRATWQKKSSTVTFLQHIVEPTSFRGDCGGSSGSRTLRPIASSSRLPNFWRKLRSLRTRPFDASSAPERCDTLPGRMLGRFSSVIASALVAAVACATPHEPAMHVQVPSAAFAGDPDAITVSWIGHATLLVGIRGHWFLTDPMFSERLAGVFSRQVEPAMAPSELPPLDAILISHAHFDHLDLPSLRRLADAPLLVPPGIPTFLPRDLPQHPVIALDAWQFWTRGGVRITAVPASHGDGRYLVDRWHTRSHTGWVIEVGER